MPHLPETILRPTQRQLRQFAAALPIAVLVTAWAMRLGSAPMLTACAASILLALAGWVYPLAMKPLYVGTALLAYPIGVVVSELVMLAVYFGLITPIALVFRLARRDALERTIDREVQSYWRAKRPPDSPASYLRRW